MGESTVHAIQFVALLILCSVVVFAALAKKLNTPYPIVLMMAGLGLAAIPGVPRVPMDPEIIFLVVLPPLLYAAAWQTSWREFQFNISSILLLAFGLVTFTVFGVAFLAPKVLPGFDWNSAFVLGAVVCTTDAIAATSIGRKLGLPQRIMDVLEGESLVNDASGLVALEIGLAMLVHRQAPTAQFVLYRLGYSVVVGIAVGLATAWVIGKLERYIEDGPVEIGVSLLVPYGLYLSSEALHASGVLAVVAAGLYLSRQSAGFFSPQVRIQVQSVWETIIFLLNGFVFVLMGLQLPYVWHEIRGMNLKEDLLYGALFSLLLVLLRLAWMYPGAYAATLIRRHVQRQQYAMPGVKQIFVVGWTGMRGVVALAAAFSLPPVLDNGQPFTQRSAIIFLTFSVIFVTLVLQGLTLPWLIHMLGFSETVERNCEEEEARYLILKAAMKQLDELRQADQETFAPVYEDLDHHYRLRLFSATGKAEGLNGGGSREHIDRFRQTSQHLRNTERQMAIRLRNEHRISDELLHRIEHELDLVDTRFSLDGA